MVQFSFFFRMQKLLFLVALTIFMIGKAYFSSTSQVIDKPNLCKAHSQYLCINILLKQIIIQYKPPRIFLTLDLFKLTSTQKIYLECVSSVYLSKSLI